MLTFAFCTVIFVALMFNGVGALLCIGQPMPSTWVERFSLRFTLGMVAAPLFSIFLFECFNLRVTPVPGMLIGGAGLLFLVWEKWIRKPRLNSSAIDVSDSTTAAPPPQVASLSPVDLAFHQRYTPALIAALGFAIFATCFIKYLSIPFLEGLDPWEHVLGVRYLMDTGSLRQPIPEFPLIQYIDAYPPLYDIIMLFPASINQLPGVATKAMNSLIVGMAVPVFYLLAKELFGCPLRALTACVLYAVLPGNLLRYIWGHSAALLFLFVGLFCVLRARQSWRWCLPGGLCFCGILLAAPSAGIKAGALLILTALALLLIKRDWGLRTIGLGLCALLLSMTWYLPMISRYGSDPKVLTAAMTQLPKRRSALSASPNAIKSPPEKKDAPSQGKREIRKLEEFQAISGKDGLWSGSRSRAYGFGEFAFFRPFAFHLGIEKIKIQEMVAPRGLGIPVLLFCLVFIFILLKEIRSVRQRPQRLLMGIWLGFAFLGLMGNALGFAFFVWRFWMLLCPFGILAATEGLFEANGKRGESSAWRRLFNLIIGCSAIVTLAGLALDFLVPPNPWKAFNEGILFLFVLLLPLLWYMRFRDKEKQTSENGGLKWIAIIVGLHILLAGPYRVYRLMLPIRDNVFGNTLERTGYLGAYLKTESNSKVWSMGGYFNHSAVVGMDRQFPLYNKDDFEFSQRLLQDPNALSPKELLMWLRKHEYRYLIVDPAFQNYAFNKSDLENNDYFKWVAALQDTGEVELLIQIPEMASKRSFKFYLFRINY